MLVITIDLVPRGLQPQRRTIASMRIASVAGRANVLDYVLEGVNPLSGTPSRIANFDVTDHNRHQSVWPLVAKAAAASLAAEYDEI
jgi:hypothetical protein